MYNQGFNASSPKEQEIGQRMSKMRERASGCVCERERERVEGGGGIYI